MIVAQLTDTHIVREGATYFDCDTARYLKDAIAALEALAPRPACAIVTGDLVNSGTHDEYVRFREIMRALSFPYFVVPGNHDDRERLRDVLGPQVFGHSRGATICFAIDAFEVRLLGLDANGTGRWPGASLDRDSMEWLERTLAQPRPTIVAVHQPPFRTGVHYLDAFGFRGARRLRALVERNPHVGRVISGHVHCVKQTHWRDTLLCSAPSTAPQIVPQIFMDGRIAGIRRERPGFALHAWSTADGFTTTVYRRDDEGRYRAMGPPPLASRWE